MGSDCVLPEEDYWDVGIHAVGDGTTDDTAALQHHINMMSFFGDTRPLVLTKKYRVTAPLVLGTRAKLHGYNHKNSQDAPAGPSTLLIDHPGHGVIIDGNYAQLQGIHIRKQAEPINAYGLWVRNGSHAKITWCQVTAGDAAGVRLDRGGLTLQNNHVNIGSGAWSWNDALLAPTRGHALVAYSVPDSFLGHNEFSGEGAGLFLEACSGLVIHDNLIYNSMVGVYLSGCARLSLHDNRIEEHYRQGVIVDWNTSGASIKGNLIHNNGAWTANPNAYERAGMLLRSGLDNSIQGNVFDNWNHAIQQPGDLDFNSPQQYGLVIKSVEDTVVRPAPVGHLIIGNVARNQGVAGLASFESSSDSVFESANVICHNIFRG